MKTIHFDTSGNLRSRSAVETILDHLLNGSTVETVHLDSSGHLLNGSMVETVHLDHLLNASTVETVHFDSSGH